MRSILLSLALSIPLFFSAAQQHDLRFKRIDGTDGLSNNWVRCVYQDDSGMIWFGTNDGMDRYDGEEIKSYRPLARADGRELNITVNAIARKSDGFFWVATDVGLFTYDRANQSFELFEPMGTNPVLHVLEDSKNRFWFSANDGLWLKNEQTGELRKFETNAEREGSIANSYANVAFEDSSGVIWVGTKGGLCQLNENKESFVTYRENEGPESLASGDVLKIAEDRQGRLWLATARGGLELMTRNESGKPSFRNVSSGKAISVIIDRENILWTAKGSGGGLLRLELDRFDELGDEAIEHYTNVLGDEWSLSDGSVYCVYEDRIGDIWAGTFGNGVNYQSKLSKRFHRVSKGEDPSISISDNKINGFLDDDNYFWIGTISGLQRRSKADGTYELFRSIVGNDTSLGADPIYTIFKDSRGNLWIGGWTTGLNRYDYETESFKRFMPSDEPGSIGHSTVYSVAEDKLGNLWVGTVGGGLHRFDYETETFDRYVHDPEVPTSISSNHINKILTTESGEIYLSTYSVLDRFDMETGVFTHYGHGANLGGESDVSNGNGGGHIIDLFEDSFGQIWIATNAGLETFDPESGTFEVITTEQGLPSNSIQGVLEDSNKNLWISTSNGLVMFENAVADPEGLRFRVITRHDGLSSNQFNKRSTYKDRDGVLYFGSDFGYTYFRPEEIKFNELPPKIALTDILFLQKSLPDSRLSYQSLGNNVNMIDKLEFPYSKSNFIIKFAALNYLTPEMNRYRYKLEGYDKDWVDAGTAGSVTYTSLPDGRYTFRVTGSNNDGIWSDEIKSLSIQVQPPWWRTLWFKSALVLLLISLLWIAYRIRFAFLRENQKVLEQRVRNRTKELQESNSMLGEANNQLAQKQEEIASQNEELHRHRDDLEQLVHERTSELEKAMKKAEESDQLKSSFLMNMSHEIRTPMNAIIGFSSLLKKDELSQEDRDRFGEVIAHNGEALLVLIDDILDISLIHSDQMKFTIETFLVDEILVELRDLYSLKNDKDVKVKLIDTNQFTGLQLTTDQVRFRQILNNLLSNAYKYTDSGEVSFGCSIKNGEAVFEVSDTGLGIAQEDQKKIFDHFYKIETNSSRLYPGTGIGLSICSKLVDKMGGRIWVESELGKGSSFFFALPIHKTSYKKSDSNKLSKQHDLTDVTVLVAEDDTTNFNLIKYSIRGSGATLHRAKNGKQAVEFVANQKSPSNLIILMDIKMPVMDGCEACSRIKEMNTNVPIVAITAYAQGSDRERIMKNGFDDLLTKPIETDKLTSLISRYTA